MQQSPRCVAALSQDRYATHVGADARSTDEVVKLIADALGLDLNLPGLPSWRYQLRPLCDGVVHVR